MALSKKLKQIQNRGVDQASQGYFQAALSAFNPLRKLHQKNAKTVSAWNHPSLVRNKLGDLLSAIRSFTEAFKQQLQLGLTGLSDEEYAAALVAGFAPETGEQLFSQPHIRELLDQKYKLLRAHLPTRKTFFDDLRALTRYLYFDSWEHLLTFMLAGLELDIPPNTS